MVRVNIIEPRNLADQHLVAEYLEIIMLTAYIKKYPEKEGIPKNYCLGRGHMKFFKDKLGYLKKRHENLKQEMRRRGFKASKIIRVNCNKCSWKPGKDDFKIIKKRLKMKLRLKPNYYRYYGEYKSVGFFVRLLKD